MGSGCVVPVNRMSVAHARDALNLFSSERYMSGSGQDTGEIEITIKVISPGGRNPGFQILFSN